MTSPDVLGPDGSGDPPSEASDVDSDVTFLRNSLFLPPDFLRRRVLQQSDDNILVRDALEEVAYFYDGDFLSEEEMAVPLQLANTLPSERGVSAEVTVIRLLHQIAALRVMRIETYGTDVVYGTTALHRKPNEESLIEYSARLNQADEAKPYLLLQETQGKRMALNVLRPVRLPPRVAAREDIKTDYRELFAQYEDALPILFGKADKGLWTPKIRSGIRIGKAALKLPA